MMSQEKFVERVLASFDKLDEKIEDLEEKYNSLHEQINVHLKVEARLDEYKKNERKKLRDDLDRQDTKKNRKFYYIIALMTLGFAAYQIIDKTLF